MNHIKTDIDKVTDFFNEETFEDLKMLLQISYREIEFCNIHFTGLGVSMRGHFDMSMEMFINKEEQILELEEKSKNMNYIYTFIHRS